MKTACLVISVSLLSGCMVGPDFTPPKGDSPAAWRQGKAESRTAATEISPQWWSLFNDPQMTRLIARASESNLDLHAASARLMQAQAARQIISGDSTPTVTGSASYQRARNSQKGLQDISGLDGKKAYSVWQPGVDVSWELDMWGRVRRELESANAGVEASAELHRDVLLSLQAETARDYIQLRSVQAQRKTTQQNLALAEHSLKLTTVKIRDGVATRLEGAEAQAQVASIQSRLPMLDQQQSRLTNALSFLLAEPPGALNVELAEAKALPATPAAVPVGLPSELTRRRPDIRAAEAKLHAATAEIGIATADFYPRVTLSGDIGLQAMQFSQLGSWGARAFSFGPSLTLPIFEGGRLRGQLALRKAQQQEAAINFQSTVLKAWHEVDDAMVEYDTYQQQRNQLKVMVENDRLALNAAQQQYVAGATDFLNVLTVQKELLNAQQALIVSDAEVSLSMVQLYKALGGGWSEERG